MLQYALKRLLGAIPTLLLVIVLAFLMVHAAPGGPFDDERVLPPETRAALEAAYNLDQPLHRQLEFNGVRLELGVGIASIEEQAGRVVAAVLAITLDPALRPLFRTDIGEQGKKLMVMLKLAVRGLDRPYTIVPAVQQLGVRHVSYGVKDEHYDTVGAALLWTLQQGLGEGFTADVKEAWTSVYGVLAGTMKSAAAEAAA